MNVQEIDEGALASEADAIVADLLPPAEAAGEVVGELVPKGEPWAQTLANITPMLRMIAFPQWNLSDAECAEFETSLGKCLDQLFPGGIDGKYGCFFRLLASCGGIVTIRMMQNGGKLPPLGPKRAEQPKQAEDDQTRKAA